MLMYHVANNKKIEHESLFIGRVVKKLSNIL